MRASTTLLALILLVGATAAQAETRPDYSPAGLQRLFAGQPETTRDDDPLRFSYGVIDYRYRNTHLQFSPALLPLSGTELRTTQVWPDPFSLTRTQIATSRRAWRTQRTLNAELRRIEKLERARLRVNTN
jgi:hypothetical protein